MATKQRSKKERKPSLKERQVAALERIAISLDSLLDFASQSGIPVALSTSWADGSIFPLDVFIHKERPKGHPSDTPDTATEL